MSVDPFSDMAAWLDMGPEEEARLRHPAGKGIAASVEVEQARMDDEACEVGSSNWDRFNEWHHRVSTTEHWLNWFVPLVIGGGIFGITFGSAVVADLGWWIA